MIVKNSKKLLTQHLLTLIVKKLKNENPINYVKMELSNLYRIQSI